MKMRLFITMFLMTLKSFAQVDSSAKMIDLVNFVRTNPKAFKAQIESFASRNFIYTKTEIGKNAVKEALNFLDTVKPVSALKFSNDILKAIGDHKGIDTATGVVNHDGRVLTRIRKYDASFYRGGENFMLITKTTSIGTKTFVNEYTMSDALAALIIDFNMTDRGHRENIFDSAYNYTAVKFIKVKGKTFLFQEFATK